MDPLHLYTLAYDGLLARMKEEYMLPGGPARQKIRNDLDREEMILSRAIRIMKRARLHRDLPEALK